MSSSKKLETFIQSLELMNDNSSNKELGNMISIFKKIAANPQKKAQLESDDNRFSGYILCIIAIIPDIIYHPKNQALKKFCTSLKPTHITHVPPFIWKRLLSITPDYQLKPRSRI